MMGELSSISAALAATKTGFDLIKGLREAVNKPTEQIKPIDIQQGLLQLQSILLDAQRALADAQEHNRELRHQLDTKAERRALEEDMDFQIDGGFYIRKSESRKGLIPYCPVCWQKDGKTVPLRNRGIAECFKCPVHAIEYSTNQGAKSLAEYYRERSEGPLRTRGSWMSS